MRPLLRLMLTSVSFIFFDLDNTLVDLEYLHYLAFATIIKKNFNINYSYEDYLHYSVGLKYPDTITNFLNAKGVKYTPTQLIKARQQLNMLKPRIINRYHHLIKIKPCAIELLQTIKYHHKGIGLVTSSSRVTAFSVLRITQLTSFFDFIITGTDVKFGKPAPEPYLAAIRKAGTSHAVVFEDSLAGVTSAKKARLPVIAIANKGINNQAVKLADYVVTSWCELL